MANSLKLESSLRRRTYSAGVNVHANERAKWDLPTKCAIMTQMTVPGECLSERWAGYSGGRRSGLWITARTCCSYYDRYGHSCGEKVVKPKMKRPRHWAEAAGRKIGRRGKRIWSSSGAGPFLAQLKEAAAAQENLQVPNARITGKDKRHKDPTKTG